MAAKARRNNLLRFSNVPPSILIVTIAASWLGMATSIILGYPLAIIGIVTILPWLPVFASEALWKYRHYAWFALFEILIVTQGLHFIEHIAQIIEVDVIGWPRSLSRGIIGNLDAEYVHFFFDTFLLIGTSVLLFGKFRRNIPLWIAWVVAVWHTIEHWYITYFYTFDFPNYDGNNPLGLRAHEGLLGHNGLLWPSSPFPRIELHFLYNLIYTTPLVWAFVLVVRTAYDEYLRKAFPRLSEAHLGRLNSNLESLQARAGEIIIRQGEPADKFYIISRGEAEVLQETGGRAVVINTLASGQFFGEVGLLTGAPRNASVRARTFCDLLALDRDTFRSVIGSSVPTAQDYAQVLALRSGSRIPAVNVAGTGGGAGVPGGVFPSGGGAFPPGGSSSPAIKPPAMMPPAMMPPAMTPPAMTPPVMTPGGSSSPAITPPVMTPPAMTQPRAPVSAPPGETLIENTFVEPPTVPTLVNAAPQTPRLEPDVSGEKTIGDPTPQFRPANIGWVYGLIFLNGDQRGQGVVLSAERMQIGRAVSSEIRLANDSLVSRHHAELVRLPNGDYQVRDLGSANGIFINNQRLASNEAQTLHPDDQMRIGASTLAFRRVSARVV
ncbi:MAG TPA: cyclic nucleotide-binding domain-containing protein [Ktedonobacterales bacterium]